MRIALVHDFLIRYGGAERVLHALHEMFPDAPIYTLFADKKLREAQFSGADIRVSFLDRLPQFLKKRYKYLAPLCIAATENFSFNGFDLVISSSSSFAKGIITNPDTKHIWYCHTPTRFLWDWTHAYARTANKKVPHFLQRTFLHAMRLWDFEAAQRPDYILANSNAVAGRVEKFYGRKAAVVYPPIEEKNSSMGSEFTLSDSEGPQTPLETCSKIPLEETANRKAASPQNEQKTKNGGELLTGQKDFFLVVSYLQNYKHVDLAVDACSKLNLPLVVIGDGPQKKSLEKRAQKNVRFLGWQSDDAVQKYLKHCKAFIFPSEDDFGIAPLEAMLYGKPVLALRAGGVLETVSEGINGEFFDSPHPAVLADGLRRIIKHYPNYHADTIKKTAERFSKERFVIALDAHLKNILGETSRI